MESYLAGRFVFRTAVPSSIFKVIAVILFIMTTKGLTLAKSGDSVL